MGRPRGRPWRPFLRLEPGFEARRKGARLIDLRKALLMAQQRLLIAGGYLEVP